jgi:hypothetical protein
MEHYSQALEAFYLTIQAFGEHALEQALHHARQAAALEPNTLVFTNAVTYLERVLATGKQRVYASGEAFSAFIRGGGNIPLYERTSSALRNVYQQYEELSLLDIGVGDGMALLPALSESVCHLDLLEPSPVMLEKTCDLLDKRGIPYRASCSTLQEFIKKPSKSWELIQTTYCLQSIAPEERLPLFAWIRQHAKRLLMTVFDVPEFSGPYAPDRIRYIVEHYEKGLAEYPDDEGFVAQGFLMPVMFGNFERSPERTNYEQPLHAWIRELQLAGFKAVTPQRLYSYWWAPAYFIDVR